jgi:NAD(P)-dependent dehydrogenase (short-subunit alcohol dehydrogenase family)
MSFVPNDWQASNDELAGKTVLITGANRGIGEAVALSCAQHGAEVLLLGRDETALARVYDQITDMGYPKPGLIPLDLNTRDPSLYAALADELAGADVVLDGLVHNASVLGERRALAQTSPESWDEVLQVNMTSVFLLTRALMPSLEAASAASVVLTSSGVGRQGKAYWGAYAVSKFATEGFMQVLADELSATSSVRVNSLNPGAVNTSMRRAAYPGEPPDTNPVPAALADRWLYLLSDASRDLHGQALSAQS